MTLWCNRSFMKLWAGETVSLLGSRVTELALPLTALLTLHSSPKQLGFLNAARFAPFLLVSLVAGVLVDRRRRRPLLITTNLARAAILALLPLAAVAGVLAIGQLYVAAFLTGALTVLFELAYLSYLPSLVERRQLVDGNSKLQASRSVADMAGSGIGGMLIGLLTAPIALLVDACSYVISAVSIASIDEREPEPPRAASRRPLLHEIRTGLRLVFAERHLRTLALVATAVNLAGGIILTVFLVFATRDLGFGAGELGVVFGIGSLGALIGSVVAARAADWRGPGPAMLATAATSCGASALLLVPADGGQLALAIVTASFFIHGASSTVANVIVISIRQWVTPHELMGRMNASYRLVTYGAIPLGAALAGYLMEALGSRATLLVGVAVAAVAFLGLVASPTGRLRAMPEPVGAT